MKTRFCLPLTTLVSIALCAHSGDFHSLPSTNAIVLNFAGEISTEVEQSIRDDFLCCLAPLAATVRLYHSNSDPTNKMSLASFCQPFSDFAATSPLGPDLPEDGIL